MIHFDSPWNPTDIEQRNGRIDRTGNKNPNINIIYYIMSDSYEENVAELLNKKAELAATIIDGGKAKPASQNFSKLALDRMLKRKLK